MSAASFKYFKTNSLCPSEESLGLEILQQLHSTWSHCRCLFNFAAVFLLQHGNKVPVDLMVVNGDVHLL